MNAHELIEMANLDAMGLLDHEERELFETAFTNAAPAVQAMVRREQLRLARFDDTLPQVELPLGLKARVMAAVRDAMQQVKVSGRSKREPSTSAVIGHIRPATGVSRLWRTASIACAAAAIAFGFVTLQFHARSVEMEQVARNSEISQYFQGEFGRQFTPRFFNGNTKFVSFAPEPAADAGRPSKATLMFDPVTKQAQLFCLDLPATNQEFEVVVVDRNGNTGRAVLTFVPTNAGIVSSMISSLDLENAKSLVIRQQGATKPLLTSNSF